MFQRSPAAGGELGLDFIAGSDFAPLNNDSHHARTRHGLRARGGSKHNCLGEARCEFVHLPTGSTQPREFDNCLAAYSSLLYSGKLTRSIPRVVMFSPRAPAKRLNPLPRNSSNNSSCKVELPLVCKSSPSGFPCRITVLHLGPRVDIAFYPKAFDQANRPLVVIWRSRAVCCGLRRQ